MRIAYYDSLILVILIAFSLFNIYWHIELKCVLLYMEDQLKHLFVVRGHGSLNQSMIDPPTCALNPIWCTLPQIVHPIIVEASLGGGLFIGNLNDACGSL